ncbi:MAG: endonuclease/exonuclease/phosphatase [Labilithrix sp.]|nr:endonuclease/exonuclease/phosphatase [Labilithrix sp.]
MTKISKRSTLLGFSGLTLLAIAAGCSSRASETSEGASSDLVTSPDLVISQVYGGGGNNKAQYTHDFVELFNRGNTAVSLNGKSLQYTSSANDFTTSNVVGLPNVSVAPGHYFLVQFKAPSNPDGAALPSPDHVGAPAVDMSATNGKLAIVPSDAPLTGCGKTGGTPCAATAWIDLVGWGSASQSEGAATPALSNTTAALRKNGGCQDNGDNSADFEVAAPAPRNGATAANVCSNNNDAGAPADAGGGSDASADASNDSSAPADAGPGASLVLLNEVKVNPPGNGDDAPWEYAEILCTPNASLSGYYFVALEGDGDSSTGSPGVADIVVDLGDHNCGANGLAYIKAANGGHPAGSAQTTVITASVLDTGKSPFENATTTFVVIKSPTTPITATTDYDAENDGTLELPTGASVVDGIAIYEEPDPGVTDQTYAPRLTQSAGSADGASRIVGNKTASSADAWYNGDLSGAGGDSVQYDAAKASPNLPAGAVLTPGAPNFEGSAAPADGGTSSGGNDDDNEEPTDEENDGTSSSSGSSSGGKKAPSSSSTSSSGGAFAAPRSDCSMASGPSGSSALSVLGGLGIAILSLRRRKSSR